jgi:multidrug efflux pump subunit AcrA (membrane-fusion protein)
LTDVRVQQPFDYPTLDIAVDRTKASQGGFTERDVTTGVLNTLSGSFQVTPMFFLNWQNGVTLNVEVDVDNPTGRLLPGAYIFVHYRAPGASHSVTIPSNTHLFRSEGLRVGVVRNDHVKLVPVTIGHDFGNAVEVLSGLSVKDAIVVNPSDSLNNGALVHAL